MPNTFQILKPIQKAWVFRNTGANAVAKNQTRLAYEDKRDLYCMGRKYDKMYNSTIFTVEGEENL